MRLVDSDDQLDCQDGFFHHGLGGLAWFGGLTQDLMLSEHHQSTHHFCVEEGGGSKKRPQGGNVM